MTGLLYNVILPKEHTALPKEHRDDVGGAKNLYDCLRDPSPSLRVTNPISVSTAGHGSAVENFRIFRSFNEQEAGESALQS